MVLNFDSVSWYLNVEVWCGRALFQLVETDYYWFLGVDEDRQLW